MKNISFKKDPDKKYDESIRTTAKRKCFMIYLVVAYILYQSYGIIQSKIQNDTTMSWAGAIAGTMILAVGSLAVAAIATIRLGKELAASEILPEDEAAAEAPVTDMEADDAGTDNVDTAQTEDNGND